MKVTQFKDEAGKQGVSFDVIKCAFERDLDAGLFFGIIAPNKTEAICFEPIEIEALKTAFERKNFFGKSCRRPIINRLPSPVNLATFAENQ